MINYCCKIRVLFTLINNIRKLYIKFDKIIKLRQEHANYFNKRLEKHPEIKTPIPSEGYDHIYQMYSIRLSNKQIRDSLKDFLLKKRIFCKIYFNPIHLTEFYKSRIGSKEGDLPITEKIAEQLLKWGAASITTNKPGYLRQQLSIKYTS